MRLRRWSEQDELHWSLSEVVLAVPFEKTYDDGILDDWLSLYEESAKPDDVRFIAAFGSEPEGLLTWKLIEWNNTIWLVDVRVRSDRRRSGIGSALIDSLKRTASTMSVRGISVETQINNVPAVRFYQRHGFAVSGFNDTLYANDDLLRQDVAVFLFWSRSTGAISI